MTAEICVMNTMGVAMAADSAVTIGGGKKVYNSANKLFSLSKFHPIGIMIFGNANFVSIPWEPIIKVYRKKLGKDYFNTTKEYAENFIKFLNDPPFKELNSKELEKKYICGTSSSFLHNLASRTIESLKRRVNQFPEDSSEQLLAEITKTEIENLLVTYEKKEFINGFNEEDIRYILTTYDSDLEEIVNKTFENLITDSVFVTHLKWISASFLLKEFSSTKTGLVISGFGETDIYPSLYSYYVEGKINNKLKINSVEEEKIGFDNTASIIPFAQSDMASTFFNGIDPALNQVSNAVLEKVLKQIPDIILKDLEEIITSEVQKKEGFKVKLSENINKVYEEYIKVIENYKTKSFKIPIVQVVQSLPKDELAEIAEALVNLTSFRRKVSSNLETVGGPIDVAVITKGDGMVWIKRKHYFDRNINQNFHQNYFRSENNEPTITREES